ncbi:MAG: bifunctional methylenetetrahydrofolate dehydrogenase/methenyltetrahydrofolate cyclohydrolase FolD [Angelakisella sp.]|jgi:methylenetetrahydrofolate dehydrogenase (NADP+)/methenyltetrahydrofolate cyclohydrolase|nr:bifunctional methylenetetrahydrofolate dehydrogenase/methenyltetrahydrofolate cyclohydrolase FolD [Angelakisella sp.]
MAAIIDGKAVSAKLRQEMKGEVAALQAKGIAPGLAVVLVGEDPASQVYVRNKIRACEELGIRSQDHRLPADTTQERLLELIGELNNDPAVHGILVQLPLPEQISDQAVIAAIDPKKDVDAFHPQNVGKIVQGNYDFLPCTPAGVMALLRSTGVPVAGKECVVIGRSNIVGKPMALLMLHEHATVTICHSRTRDLAEVCRRADILIVAIGKARFVTAGMVKEGAVVIDVGMDRDENGKLCGDVDFAGVEPKAGYITPVPGGVGPMTITMLMQNTITAARLAGGAV